MTAAWLTGHKVHVGQVCGLISLMREEDQRIAAPAEW
jgi:hypothetical protein